MKGMGHNFQEWDAWAESAGCSCSNREARWSSFLATDRDYTAIIGMAYNMGWLRGPDAQGNDQGDAQGNAQDFPPGIPLRPDFDAMRAAGWMMDNRKRLTRGANINALLDLEALDLQYRFDEWAQVIKDDAGNPVNLNELPNQLKCTIERFFVRVNHAPALGSVEAAVWNMARGNAFNPVGWAGPVGTLEFGTPDAALYNEQGALIPRGAVVSALEPGARFPYIPLLYSSKAGNGQRGRSGAYRPRGAA